MVPAVVILAGGAARRVGGAMKSAYRIGGRTLLERVLDAVPSPGWSPRIVVGPPELVELLPPDVLLTRETPPGGGPVAAIAAGLARLPDPAEHPITEEPFRVAIFAADLPFLSPVAVT